MRHNYAGYLRICPRGSAAAKEGSAITQDRQRVITLITLFRLTARRMVDELIERLRAGGFEDMTAAHHPLFENIDPGGTRLTVLAARAGMTHQSMGELVRGLEVSGYLERRADPSDGRARLVALTPKGRAAVRLAVKEIGAIEAAWLERVGAAGFHPDARALLEAGLQAGQNEIERGSTGE
jgi:DNA-binding MarR family transcriptional regulator